MDLHSSITVRSLAPFTAFGYSAMRLRQKSPTRKIKTWRRLREPHLAALAAPIRPSRGELEAIVALQGPSSRVDDAAVDAAVPPRRARRSDLP